MIETLSRKWHGISYTHPDSGAGPIVADKVPSLHSSGAPAVDDLFTIDRDESACAEVSQ